MVSRGTIGRYDGVLLDDLTQYRRLVESLQYVTLSKSKIFFYINKLCQFMAFPTDFHCIVTKCVLMYLKKTTYLSLTIYKSDSL